MTREKSVPRNFYKNYLIKAEEFYDSMEYNFEKENWDSCVSSAIHAVICIVDAIAIQQLGRRSSSQSHMETYLLLNDIKTSDENRKSNLKGDLKDLISLKTTSEYEEKLMSRGDAEKSLNKTKKIYSFIVDEIKKMEI